MHSNPAKRQKVEHHQAENDVSNPTVGWTDEMKAFYNDFWVMESDEAFIQWYNLCHSPKNETLICAMCGGDGHTLTSCPNSCCLKCGEKTDEFQNDCGNCLVWTTSICELCGYRGHVEKDCPNHWKCYHSTIDNASVPEHSMLEYSNNYEFDRDNNEIPTLDNNKR